MKIVLLEHENEHMFCFAGGTMITIDVENMKDIIKKENVNITLFLKGENQCLKSPAAIICHDIDMDIFYGQKELVKVPYLQITKLEYDHIDFHMEIIKFYYNHLKIGLQITKSAV